MLDLIELLKDKLSGPLPGIDAQYEMAPITRIKLNIADLKPGSYKKSAVMLFIFSNGNKLYIPLIERQTYDGKHSGQISLPGGKYDATDETLQNTALRELKEELGVNSPVEVIGALTPLYIPVSNFYVEPYVGVCKKNEIRFEPNKREVKKLIYIDLEQLKDEKIMEMGGIVSGDGYKLKTPYFYIEGHIIWGATAMILNEFKKLII